MQVIVEVEVLPKNKGDYSTPVRVGKVIGFFYDRKDKGEVGTKEIEKFFQEINRKLLTKNIIASIDKRDVRSKSPL